MKLIRVSSKSILTVTVINKFVKGMEIKALILKNNYLGNRK